MNHSQSPLRLAIHFALLPLALSMSLGNVQAAEKKEVHDYFYYLGEMNKASTVMVIENNIVDAL